MNKYIGTHILHEVGTNKELASVYGVSERTIYRWKAKARAETGEKIKKPRRPRQSTLENFQGTRKELAKKYGVSERTAYRWLEKARTQGADIPSRRNKTKYPGTAILEETGSNSKIGDRYGVSESTIRRWKQKARQEREAAGLPEEIFTEDQLPQEIFTLDQLPEEITFEDEEFESEPELEFEGKTFEDATQQNLYDITTRLLNPDNELITDGSIFRKLSLEEQMDYIDMYLQYQYELDEHQFYNPETHKMDFSPEFVSNINIWGEEFEDWAQKQHDYGEFEIPY